MENPRGFLRQFIGTPHYNFEQWWFGDPKIIKSTDIWGYFKEPVSKIKVKPKDLTVRYPNGRANGRDWAKIHCPPEYAHINLDRAALRAITPPGFAQAFFKANR